MAEIDKISYCLHCGYNNKPQEDDAIKYRRFIVDGNKETSEIGRRNLLNNLDGSLSYCTNRGMTRNIIDRWELGYIPSRFSRLTDQWHERLLFPIRSMDGENVVGFGGRKIKTDDRPKYVNSRSTQEYEKRKLLYGGWLLPEKTDVIYLCEGYVDVITMDKHGYAYPVASLGTSLTPEQAELIYEKANNVVIAYDSDNPGQIATARALELLRKAGFEWKAISILRVIGAKDVDECLTRGGTLQKISVEDFYASNSMWKELAEVQLEGGST